MKLINWTEGCRPRRRPFRRRPKPKDRMPQTFASWWLSLSTCTITYGRRMLPESPTAITMTTTTTRRVQQPRGRLWQRRQRARRPGPRPRVAPSSSQIINGVKVHRRRRWRTDRLEAGPKWHRSEGPPLLPLLPTPGNAACRPHASPVRPPTLPATVIKWNRHGFHRSNRRYDNEKRLGKKQSEPDARHGAIEVH